MGLALGSTSSRESKEGNGRDEGKGEEERALSGQRVRRRKGPFLGRGMGDGGMGDGSACGGYAEVGLEGWGLGSSLWI